MDKSEKLKNLTEMFYPRIELEIITRILEERGMRIHNLEDDLLLAIEDLLEIQNNKKLQIDTNREKCELERINIFTPKKMNNFGMNPQFDSPNIQFNQHYFKKKNSSQSVIKCKKNKIEFNDISKSCREKENIMKQEEDIPYHKYVDSEMNKSTRFVKENYQQNESELGKINKEKKSIGQKFKSKMTDKIDFLKNIFQSS